MKKYRKTNINNCIIKISIFNIQTKNKIYIIYNFLILEKQNRYNKDYTFEKVSYNWIFLN